MPMKPHPLISRKNRDRLSPFGEGRYFSSNPNILSYTSSVKNASTKLSKNSLQSSQLPSPPVEKGKK
ncbi:MAG: hypothetical protein JWO92_1415 [Chitinophagaceae bacterium]|nr:hypothetical protein [Chitinophagaceae bacterium]